MVKLEKIIERGFYLFIFLLPWQTRLIWHDARLNGYVWEYGRFSWYGTQLLLWGLLLLYGLWLVKTKPLPKFSVGIVLSQLRRTEVSLYWLSVLLVIVAGLSIFWALDASIAYYRWLVLVQAVALMSMVALLNF